MHMPGTKRGNAISNHLIQPIQIASTSIAIDNPSQLHIVVYQPNLLTRLERRQSNIRTAIAPERISKRAVAARADLALHGEVHFREVFGLQFGEVGVCVGALRGVFGVEALGQAAAAVLAGAAALGVRFAGFGCESLLVLVEALGGFDCSHLRIFNGFKRSSSVSNESGSILSARSSSSLLGISMSSSSS